MKRTGKEVYRMLVFLYKDYKSSGVLPKKIRLVCYKKVVRFIIGLLWAKISAPLVYPIWFMLRKRLWASQNGNWKGIKAGVDINETSGVKFLISNKDNGSKFQYWLWTYGDLNDPLGRGGMPDDYKNGKNTFWNRWRYSALRNPRFNWNYMELRTQPICFAVTCIDTRNYEVMHMSYGIGNSPDGVCFRWFKDIEDNWYFIYEDNNKNSIWYFGWVGLLQQAIGNNGRFEISYRKTQGTYKAIKGTYTVKDQQS